MEDTMRGLNKMKMVMVGLFFVFALQACGYLKVNNQDFATITALEEIKTDAVVVYGTFTLADVDEGVIEVLTEKIDLLQKREDARGDENIEVRTQVTILGHMFEKHVDYRIAKGPYSATHLANTKQNFDDLIDIIVATERAKPLQ
jgi:uncharacterized membrane protein (Fun14 family)